MEKAAKTRKEITASKAVANNIVITSGKSVDNLYGVQMKLNIGRPNDKYEQEADTVADQVMAIPEPVNTIGTFSSRSDREIHSRPILQMINPFIQRQPLEEEEEPVQVKPEIQEQEEEEELIQSRPEIQKQEEEEEIVQANPEIRKQEEEEEEPIQAKRENGEYHIAPSSIENSIKQSRGQGSPLSNDTRSFMESRFGADFGHVRVHYDSNAVKMNRGLNARAFTHGSNIYFNSGRYDPGSTEGQRLLAHELTHVVQQTSHRSVQNGKKENVNQKENTRHCQFNQEDRLQMARPDYQIRGIAPSAASAPNTIYFDYNSSSLSSAEVSKISVLATPAGRNLTLHGYASEEGSSASRSTITNNRIATVDSAMAAAGHTGTRNPQPHPDDRVGSINYREARSVEVIATPVGLNAAPPSLGSCTTVTASCGYSFTDAHRQATTMLANAISALGPPVSPAASALLGTLFSRVPAATIRTNLGLLQTHLASMHTQHRCHNQCDPGCGRPAYNTGVGIGAGGAMVTLCPDFINSTSTIDNAETLLHEGAHGTAGFAAEDIAYSNSRMIPFLTPSQSVRNNDSYMLFIRLINAPGSVTIGPTTPDPTTGGMSSSEQTDSRHAIALLESWLLYADSDTEYLYDTVNRSITLAAGWANDPGDAFNRETMQLIAPLFGMTRPGTSAPYRQPTVRDKYKIAAIHDRYLQMRQAVWGIPITVNKITSGISSWAAGLGSSVSVLPGFFRLTLRRKIRMLIRLMAKVTSGISSALINTYSQAADRIRQHRGIGP